MIHRFACLLLTVLLSAPAVADELTATFVKASKVPLSNPHDLKLSPDGRLLFVADVGHSRVAILDPESLEPVGELGRGHQSGTHDVDFDEGNRLYVADTHNHRVIVYELDGTDATRVGQLGERIRGPEGVLAHPNGQVYVAGAWSNNVVAYRDGRVVGELTGLSSPHDVELAADGDNLWLADAGNDRMLLLSPELRILREWRGDPFDFAGVRYQDVLPDGTLIVADKNHHVVKFFADDGSLRLVLGTGKPESGPGRFTTPEGIEVRGSTLWIADSGNDRVVKYALMVR